MEHRYAIELSYFGEAYNGWQRQSKHPSIQQTIEQAFSELLRYPVEITGCGRTDTGVHARRYWAHADLHDKINSNFLYRLNKFLPRDISILSMNTVAPDWHARFSAESRTYRYFVHRVKDPFLTGRSFWLRNYDPDPELMQEGCRIIKQYKDFSIFEKKGSDNEHALCDIMKAEWIEDMEARTYYFEITANRFLRNMVRRVTATLIEIGIGRLSLLHLENALNGIEKLNTSMAVPACGLFLWDVSYPKEIYTGKKG